MSYRRGFLGYEMAQNSHAIPTFDEFFARIGKVARMVEIGTAKGGLAVFLQLYAMATGAEFTTIDVEHNPQYVKLLRKFHTRRLIEDAFSLRILFFMRGSLMGEGTSVVLCDGGNKVKEFQTFAPMLKPGDYILAHDFAESRKTWVKDEHWKCCEIELSDIAETVAACGLERYMKDEFTKAAWCCFKKA